MKKMFACLLFLVPFITTHASTPPAKEPPNANGILLPVGTTGKWISLMTLSTIPVKEYEALRGKKLSLFAKIGFRLGQKRLLSRINDDGTIANKRFLQHAVKMAQEGGTTGFHAGGFFLGLFLLYFGVLIAYSIRDNKRRNRVKWAWIGFGVSAVTLLIIGFTSGTFAWLFS